MQPLDQNWELLLKALAEHIEMHFTTELMVRFPFYSGQPKTIFHQLLLSQYPNKIPSVEKPSRHIREFKKP